MDEDLCQELLDETVELAEEDGATATCAKFTDFIQEMLPPEILQALEDINGDASFLVDMWEERFKPEEVEEVDDAWWKLLPGCCLVCENFRRLTKHHVYPREVHKKLIKKGYVEHALHTTIDICRMCHSTIHRFFSNEDLAFHYFSLELLLADEKFMKYAKWAAKQSRQLRAK
mmetsp:Transcript_14050/g.31052  ORF Transcript_14050/g.31052 Transcript_14050/m.31052 type:complete len:173 (+) Transcript_14050:50-568(+)